MRYRYYCGVQTEKTDTIGVSSAYSDFAPQPLLAAGPNALLTWTLDIEPFFKRFPAQASKAYPRLRSNAPFLKKISETQRVISQW